MDFDLILKDGTILDGTGAAGVGGSVAVKDGRIAAVGDLGAAQAATTLDCAGKVIAPGFIDMHSHSDWVHPATPDHGAVLAPLLEQGITTIVGGNCGCSPAPFLARQPRAAAAGRPHAARPRPRLSAGGHGRASWRRSSSARTGAQPRAAGRSRHVARRREGDRARRRRRPDETARRWPTSRAPRSTRAPSACPPASATRPGCSPTLDELVGITAPLKERGGVYTSHARSYIALGSLDDPEQLPSNLRALDETAAVCRAHGVTVQHSHLIFVGDTHVADHRSRARTPRSSRRRGRRHRLRRLPLRRRQHDAGRLHAAVDADPTCTPR